MSVTYSLRPFLSGVRLLPSATLRRVVPLWNRTWVISIEYCRYFGHSWLQCAHSANLCPLLVCLTVCTYKKRTTISHDLFLHSYPFSLFVNFIIFFLLPIGSTYTSRKNCCRLLKLSKNNKKTSLCIIISHVPCSMFYTAHLFTNCCALYYVSTLACYFLPTNTPHFLLVRKIQFLTES